ncbi:hypothetical protein TEA_011619 [Camellia sinensis var. sinensis]|uniref:Uncharacterized protein n=1 Tax=Camellia sinensis var. sinensis TaxID=542762 RepID=A0A4V3WNH5_CAMSN|nr:hypothetical protein TEA_011619 [Camellia sinensis var. sinensis]
MEKHKGSSILSVVHHALQDEDMTYVEEMRKILMDKNWGVPTTICWGQRDRWLTFDGVEDFCEISKHRLIELPMFISFYGILENETFSFQSLDPPHMWAFFFWELSLWLHVRDARAIISGLQFGSGLGCRMCGGHATCAVFAAARAIDLGSFRFLLFLAILEAGHHVQEDCGEELGQIIAGIISKRTRF